MPGVSRVTVDSAGGVITGALAPTVYVNNNKIAVKGCAVASHGTAPHSAPTMQGSSSTVYANGIKVCRQGDAASCGHTASGSANVFSG